MLNLSPKELKAIAKLGALKAIKPYQKIDYEVLLEHQNH